MNDLQIISNLYAEIDQYFDELRESSNISQTELMEIEKKQVINDQAYFVLAWGQFETEVEDACISVIRNGQSNSNWRNSRVWNLYNTSNLRMNFKNKLSLVLEENSSEWQQVLRYYRLRNQIAHGELESTRILPSMVFIELLQIQNKLERA